MLLRYNDPPYFLKHSFLLLRYKLDTTGSVVYGLAWDIVLYVTVYVGVWIVLPGGWQWIGTVRRFSRELTSPSEESPTVEVSDS